MGRGVTRFLPAKRSNLYCMWIGASMEYAGDVDTRHVNHTHKFPKLQTLSHDYNPHCTHVPPLFPPRILLLSSFTLFAHAATLGCTHVPPLSLLSPSPTARPATLTATLASISLAISSAIHAGRDAVLAFTLTFTHAAALTMTHAASLTSS